MLSSSFITASKGIFLVDSGKYEQAATAYEKQEGICRDLGFLESLATVLNNRAYLLTTEAATNATALVEQAYTIALENGLGYLITRSKDNLDNLRGGVETPR